MIALAKSLALALGKHGVTVNAINPGITDTPLARSRDPQWEEKRALDVLGRYSQPEEIAETVLFLAGTAGAIHDRPDHRDTGLDTGRDVARHANCVYAERRDLHDFFGGGEAGRDLHRAGHAQRLHAVLVRLLADRRGRPPRR